ncbi:MAG: ABC transporter permease [Silvibacterium sp.]|nr:ABC transporter permease [Silvibacterium sp.]
MRDGLPREQALRRAKADFGSIAAGKENCRQAWGTRWFDELRADLRYAIRMLAKSPGFALIAVTSLALGIGCNTTIFCFTRHVLLDKLNVYQPEDLRLFAWTGGENRVPLRIWGHWSELTHTCTSFSYPVYQHLRRQNSVFEDVFAFKDIPQVTVAAEEKPEAITAELVSGNYYSALGVSAILGRGIQSSDDDAPGNGAVAVISDGFWSRHFGRSPDAIGKTLRVNLMPVTIVGVNPPAFTGASSVQISPDIFLPFSMEAIVAPNGTKSLLTNPDQCWVLVMGRIKPGISNESARVAMDVLLSNAGSR